MDGRVYSCIEFFTHSSHSFLFLCRLCYCDNNLWLPCKNHLHISDKLRTFQMHLIHYVPFYNPVCQPSPYLSPSLFSTLSLSLSILNLWLLQFKVLNFLPVLSILNTSFALPLRAENNVWSSLKGNWFTTCFFKRKEKNSFQHFNEYHSLQKVLKRSRFPFFLSFFLLFFLLFSSPFQSPFSHFFLGLLEN